MLEIDPKSFHLVAKKIKVFESELKKIFNVHFFAFSLTFFNMNLRGFFYTELFGFLLSSVR